MRRSRLAILSISLLLPLTIFDAPGAPLATHKTVNSSGFAVVAYYTQWSVCDMPPQYVDWSAITHMIYFWGEPIPSPPYFSLTAGSSDSLTFETGQPGWCPNPIPGKTHQQIILDSARAHGVKLLLCVGGEWGSPASDFANMIADTSQGGKQDQFIAAALGFIQRHGYNGMDIDWEFADQGPAGRANFNRFLYKVRSQLNTWNPPGLLTMAMPTWFWWDVAQTDPYIDVKTVNDCFDFCDLMEYGMENTGKISHHGPLYENPAASQEAWNTRGINEWKGAGVIPTKIIPLIPFECTQMTDNSGISPVAIGHAAGGNQWTQLKNVPANAVRMWDDIAKNSWAYSGNTFYSFENDQSISQKVQYARNQGAGGVGVWELWEDWLPDAPPGQQAPMLAALKNSVGGFSAPPDSINPQVTLLSPRDGDTVSGTVTLAASASDNVAVSRVEFLVDGATVGSLYYPPFQYAWQSGASIGSRLISARAFDASGNSSTTPGARVTVEPAPVVQAEPWVYADTLESPWRDSSWNSTNSYQNTEHVFSGAFSLKASQSAWGAVSARSGSQGSPVDVDPTKYSAFEFAIYNTTPGLSLNVYCYNDNGDAFPDGIQDNVPVNQWTLVSLPMSQMNPNNYTIHRVNIQNYTRLNPVFYVDNVHFVEKVTAAAPGLEPPTYSLAQNYPNPFNPSTRISYSLASPGRVSLKIYNVLGELVTTLLSGTQSGGPKSVLWNSTDLHGRPVPSGIYFYRLEAGNDPSHPFVSMKKMILMK